MEEDFGFDDFVQRIGAMVQPGDSAACAAAQHRPRLRGLQFRGYGGTILRTTLTPGQRAKVEATLRAS